MVLTVPARVGRRDGEDEDAGGDQRDDYQQADDVVHVSHRHQRVGTGRSRDRRRASVKWRCRWPSRSMPYLARPTQLCRSDSVRRRSSAGSVQLEEVAREHRHAAAGSRVDEERGTTSSKKNFRSRPRVWSGLDAWPTNASIDHERFAVEHVQATNSPGERGQRCR